MRILHFSDIHYGRPSFEPSALFDKRLLGTFNYIFRRKGDVDETLVPRLLQKLPEIKPDLIVCSGDITCVGSPAEFQAARDALRPFARQNGIPFVYVPGNHDAYIRRKSCAEALGETCRDLNPKSLDGLLENGFAALKNGPAGIALLAQAHPTNIFLSSGTLPDKTVPPLDAWMRECREADAPAILIGHFPTRRADGRPLGFRRHLRQADAISQGLEKGDVTLYLCGHIHSPFVRKLASGSLECCSGSLTMKRVYSIIDIDSRVSFRHRYENL